MQRSICLLCWRLAVELCDHVAPIPDVRECDRGSSSDCIIDHGALPFEYSESSFVVSLTKDGYHRLSLYRLI